MSVLSISGNDTLVLKNRLITDFADGDNSALTFPTDLITVKTGKNGNSIFSKNEAGFNGELVLRIIRSSPDDKFLNTEISQIDNDFPSYTLIDGSFVKKIGDGKGGVTSDRYNLQAGVIKKLVESKDNAEGDTEQAISIYTLSFAYINRALT